MKPYAKFIPRIILLCAIGIIFLSQLSCSKDYDGTDVEPNVERSILPIVIIKTPDSQPITSKDMYIEDAQISIIGKKSEDDFYGTMKIKGRGNINWIEAPKKAYAIKFTEQQSLLSYPKGKSWVLLGNYYDKTLQKTDIALFMGHQMSKLDYTPNMDFVELELNNNYLGIYQLGEKPRISKKRVDVGNDGFLLEIDAKAWDKDDVIFKTPHLEQPINIKDPDIIPDGDDFNYIKNFVTNAETALYADNFTNPDDGYRKYIDVDSFVEWYLINEISKNNDAAFYSSCYMHLKRGEKLKMGPIWDFDWAFGGTTLNGNNSPEGFWIKIAASWYIRLFQDPTFVKRVKQRFNELYVNRQIIYTHMDENTSTILKLILKDNKVWGKVSPKTAEIDEVQSTYSEKVEELKDWIEKRFKWLNTNINSLPE